MTPPARRSGTKAADVADDLQDLENRVTDRLGGVDARFAEFDRRLGALDGSLRGEIAAIGTRMDNGFESMRGQLITTFRQLGFALIGFAIVCLFLVVALLGGAMYARGYGIEIGSSAYVTPSSPAPAPAPRPVPVPMPIVVPAAHEADDTDPPDPPERPR